jgi:hypothetical protein
VIGDKARVTTQAALATRVVPGDPAMGSKPCRRTPVSCFQGRFPSLRLAAGTHC